MEINTRSSSLIGSSKTFCQKTIFFAFTTTLGMNTSTAKFKFIFIALCEILQVSHSLMKINSLVSFFKECLFQGNWNEKILSSLLQNLNDYVIYATFLFG